MEAFPGNSNVNKTKKSISEKKVEKVTTGEVVLKKRSLGERFRSVFFGADLKSVIRYVTADVLLPALKNMAVDTIEQGAKRAIYGDAGSRRRSTNQGPMQPRISYNNPVDRRYSSGTRLPDQPLHYAGNRRQQAVGEIILESRAEAEKVVDGMRTILDQYDTVTVADLYDLVGFAASHIDHNWGWTSLPYISVRQTREGYVIDLPSAESL
jgi:hypothetical protein